MTDDKFTPEHARALREDATRGPWSSIRIGADGDGRPRSAEAQVCAGEDLNAPAVFIVQGDGSPEWLANVLLAAAAPELVDAYLAEHERAEAAERILRGTPDERVEAMRKRARALIERDPVQALANVATALAMEEVRAVDDLKAATEPFVGGPVAAPDVDSSGVPWCSGDDCGAYDGKRCELLGQRPDRICEPAVIDLAGRYRGAGEVVYTDETPRLELATVEQLEAELAKRRAGEAG